MSHSLISEDQKSFNTETINQSINQLGNRIKPVNAASLIALAWGDYRGPIVKLVQGHILFVCLFVCCYSTEHETCISTARERSKDMRDHRCYVRNLGSVCLQSFTVTK